jgi:3-methylcrotonyl-CoA carboxylase alpha subunit
MIERLLIANRGEIAVRIIRTCRKLGIAAIAVFSEADRGARYVTLADEAYFIGAAEASDSYLDAQKIIALAQRVGAHAIHPGYGFLSENAAFAARCESAGITFVGPSADVIEQMGSKIESKRIAAVCGVPTVPGYFGELQSPERLRAEAQQIGVPLLIKASAGVREAETAFGDRQVLLEKYVDQPRHLEVQVLGDHHGNLVHLFERECSIQRNHQKVIEEAPAAFLERELRDSLYEQALRLCRHIGYRSAGTVEFLLDHTSGNLYFLEMNTRLQVEHPVTELITGVDLVEWQIRIAGGETLSFSQPDLAPSGWAIEARITAENPADHYRPETGRLEFYREPRNRGVRVDSGVLEGSEVSSYYDPLLAKVIAAGDHRDQARDRLLEALRDYVLAGVGNNIGFLQGLLSHPAFLSQPLTTHYIEDCFPGGWHPVNEPAERLLVVALLAWTVRGDILNPLHQTPWGALRDWRLLRNAGHRPQQLLVLRDAAGCSHRLQSSVASRGYSIAIGEHVIRAGEPRFPDGEIEVEVDGVLVRYLLKVEAHRVLLARGADSHAFEIIPQREALAGDSETELTGEGVIRAPMPGAVESIKVGVGDRVGSGDVLVTMEAMKLVHSLASSVDGTVSAIHCREGEIIEANALLLEIETNAI